MNEFEHTPELVDRHAVVTGASGPIGAEIARRLAQLGARTTIVGRRETALRELEKSMAPADCTTAVCDLTDPRAVSALRHGVGPADLLVCAAGGGGRPCVLTDMSPAMWRETLDLNLTTTFLTLQAFVPDMVDRGSGAVVVINSDAAVTGTTASFAYAAAKSAVLTLTRRIAADTARHGVRVNTIAPGSIRTTEIDALPTSVQDKLAATHPSGRLGTVTDVAELALFLLSDRAAWSTGQMLVAGARDLT